MTKLSRRLLLSCLLLLPLSAPVMAADVPLEFADPVLQQRYQDLLEELRCLVCQNQSLADSHADLAQDLRWEVYEQVLDGKDDKAITTFLVERYGDFVIYRPPFSYRTALLWSGPFLLLLLAGFFILRGIKRRQPGSHSTLTTADKTRLQTLLDDKQE
ncbi:MAG: cytochrome c-type biogenesis protein [Gammaproteobacteria bacterium]